MLNTEIYGLKYEYKFEYVTNQIEGAQGQVENTATTDRTTDPNV